MKRLLFLLSVFTLFLNQALFSQVREQTRDGKLLQGDKWMKFSYPEKADFYVSPSGNDSWSGTLPDPSNDKSDGPFITIERAQKAVRDLKSKVYFPKDPPVEKRWIGSPHPLGRGKDILVYIRDGYYFLQKPLVFEPEDGGERVETNLPTGAFEYHKLKDHYVTYAAYPGEKPVISGGIPVTGWKIQGKTWIAPYDADTAAMLIINGKMQTLARTPDEGYFVPPAISKSTVELYFNKGDIKPWKDLEGNRIIMLLRWHTGINTIVKVDEKNRVATFRTPQDGVVIVPPRYYIENVKSLLNAPGEWFFDKKTDELSYIPLDGISKPDQIKAGISVLSQLIDVEGKLGKPVRNLRLYGLTFEGTASGNSTVTYKFAHACEFADNEVRSCGGTAISVKEGCYQTRLMNNIFETIDNGGIYANGPSKPGDGREITRETLISYNKFYNCGGINIYSSYTLLTTISHNYITKTRGRYGIDAGGWANQEEAIDGGYLVEYNHLDDVQLGADDSGAIKTAGMTFNSIVRGNLIHNVNAGFFNDNVGFWFDNMSSGWTSEENIFYSLEQGEMKLCAAMIEDNAYHNNFTIEPPANSPELIIEGRPEFTETNLAIKTGSKTSSGSIPTGSSILISADVFNSGSTGMDEVELYIDGKVSGKKLFPVIKNNTRKIHFETRIYDEGDHTVAIGSTPYQTIKVEGNKPAIVFEDFRLSEGRLLYGEKIRATATARNLTSAAQKMDVSVSMDASIIAGKSIELNGNESKEISFEIAPPPGIHKIKIENSAAKDLTVFEAAPVDISKKEILQYCSAKAKPFTVESDAKSNRFTITAGGSDFFHAEDSYASVYIKGIKGDFVATVTIRSFGNRTHEWFRSGLFVRNDISKSFDVQPGSKGSVLVFGTPGRAGIEYDEFANGCMHKASSQNLPENSKTPIYLKMVRHGNSFSGYISLDGENWIIERHTKDIPGIAESVDIGLAAGGPDKQQYTVEFTDWKIETASAASFGANLTAHTATVDITPPLEMKYTLGGYGERMNRPAESIHDRIFAKALAFRNGERKYAIITLDLLGLPSNVKSDLVKRVSSSGWNMENILLLPSHSHGSLEMEALNSNNLLNNPQIGIYQPELLEFLINKLTKLITEADRDYKPVKIGTGSKIIEGLNHNRRGDPEVDKELIVTRIDLINGIPLAVLVNWTAHPTFIDSKDMMVSAEWPGYLQEELEKSIGNNVTAMFYNGAEGDQSPVLDSNLDDYEKAEAYGRLIAQKSFELYKEIRTENIKDFSSNYNTIKLPEQKAHPSFMKTGGEEYGLDENSIKAVIKMLSPQEADLGTFRLGNLIIVGVPGEMTAILGLKLKSDLKNKGIKYVAIGGLANEWISYILSRDQYIHGEGYESSVSFYGPDLGSFILEEAVKTAAPLIQKR